MNVKVVAKQNLTDCKQIAKVKKAEQIINCCKYIVYSMSTNKPMVICNSEDEAIAFVKDTIDFDRYLYESYEDECIICDYFITKANETIVHYYDVR